MVDQHTNSENDISEKGASTIDASKSDVSKPPTFSLTRKSFLKYSFLSMAGVSFTAVANNFLTLKNNYRFGEDNLVHTDLADSPILWPALGHPGSLDKKAGSSFWVYLNVSEKIDNEVLSASLVPVNKVSSKDSSKEGTIALQVLEVETISLQQSTEAGIFSSWVQAQGKSSLKVKLAHSQDIDLGLKKNLLYDLRVVIGGQVYNKVNSVFVSDSANSQQKLLVASDTHVCSRWDQLEKNVAERFETRAKIKAVSLNDLLQFKTDDFMTQDCFEGSWVNPNRNFASFIASANDLHERGELDALVLVGDIVDYKFRMPKAVSGYAYEDTEWSFLEDLLLGKAEYSERLRAPIFMTTGNHDYRLHPYNMQVYGIRHCGVPTDFTNEYLDRMGELRTVLVAPEDLNSVRINTGRNHSLNYYYKHFNPMDNCQVQFNDMQLVLMDTGPDFFTERSEAYGRDWKKYLVELFDIAAADSIGFSVDQIKFFKQALERKVDGATLVFTHAPVFESPGSNPLPNKSLKEHSLKISLPMKEYSYKTVKFFEKMITKNRIDSGIIYKNKLPLLQLLSRLKGQAMVLSGHTHRSIEFGVNKTSGEVFVSDYSGSENLASSLEDRSLFMVGGSLGHVDRGRQEQNKPSFRALSAIDGAVTQIDKLTVDAAPFNKIFSHIVLGAKQDGEKMLETARIIFDVGPMLEADQLTHKVIVAFKDGDGAFVEPPANLEIKAMSGNLLKESLQENARVYLLSGSEEAEFGIANRPEDLTIVFAAENFSQSSMGYQSHGLLRFHHELTNQQAFV